MLCVAVGGVSFLLTVLLVHFVWQVSTLDTAAYTVYGVLKAVDLLLIVAGGNRRRD